MQPTREDLLSPAHTPSSPANAGVKRANNTPIWIAAAIAIAFLFAVALGAKDRAELTEVKEPGMQQSASGTPTRSSKSFANELAAGVEVSFIKPDEEVIPGDENSTLAEQTPAVSDAVVTVVLPDNLEAPPVLDQSDSKITDDMRERARNERFERFSEALKAKTAVTTDTQLDTRRSEGVSTDARNLAEARARLEAQRANLQALAENHADPSSAYMAKLADARRIAGVGGAGNPAGAAASGSPFVDNQSAATYAQFDRDEFGNDRWALGSDVEPPRSNYELRAGFIIPATMISGVNSDLPGQIIAQVNQDIHDTATQRHVLIPQGARLVGSYSSDVSYGSERLLVAWQRIVFPDGKALDLGSMPGADAGGYAGFNDRVNTHMGRLIGSAFLMSGITAGITLSQNRPSDNDRVDASSAISESLGQQLGQVTAQLIAKNLNVSPTLEIRPGYRFNVVVTKDITLSTPYKSFDYRSDSN